jgi:hypothetical protein
MIGLQQLEELAHKAVMEALEQVNLVQAVVVVV